MVTGKEKVFQNTVTGKKSGCQIVVTGKKNGCQIVVTGKKNGFQILVTGKNQFWHFFLLCLQEPGQGARQGDSYFHFTLSESIKSFPVHYIALFSIKSKFKYSKTFYIDVNLFKSAKSIVFYLFFTVNIFNNRIKYKANFL